MNSPTFIKRFGQFSIGVAILYFSLETYYHVTFGQSLIQLLADYIAVGLLIFGGITVIKTPKGVGIICGAWGYNFCINYRAFAWRMDKVMENDSSNLIDTMVIILATCMIFSLSAFIISLKLCYPKKQA